MPTTLALSGGRSAKQMLTLLSCSGDSLSPLLLIQETFPHTPSDNSHPHASAITVCSLNCRIVRQEEGRQYNSGLTRVVDRKGREPRERKGRCVNRRLEVFV